MNELIHKLAEHCDFYVGNEHYDKSHEEQQRLFMEKFAELVVQEYVSEYNKLINGEAVVLPKDREHAEALVRVGMFYLENNK
jgi:hypothetical protein